MSNKQLIFISNQTQLISNWAKTAEVAGFHVQLAADASQLDNEACQQAHAVFEWLPLNRKKAFWEVHETAFPEDAIIFTASHECMVTRIAANFKNGCRVVGFSPVGLHRSAATSILTLAAPLQCTVHVQEAAKALLLQMGWQTEWVKDTPGLIVPRIYAMLANEAAFALQEGVASAEDIDTAMKLGTNYPLGPLEWADQIGINTVVGILDDLWHAYREARYRPCLLLQKMAMAGQIGKASGQGFYTYEPSAAPIAEATAMLDKIQVESHS